MEVLEPTTVALHPSVRSPGRLHGRAWHRWPAAQIVVDEVSGDDSRPSHMIALTNAQVRRRQGPPIGRDIVRRAHALIGVANALQNELGARRHVRADADQAARQQKAVAARFSASVFAIAPSQFDPSVVPEDGISPARD